MIKFYVDTPTTRIVVQAADVLEEQVAWLSKYLKKLLDEGKRIDATTRIQVGWSVLCFEPENGELVACEPDFSGNPFVDLTRDLSRTLLILTEQSNLLKKLHVDGVSVKFSDKIVLAKGCLTARRIYLERTEPSNRESGWYIGPVDDEDEKVEYESLFVYGLLLQRPSAMQVLFLPPGYLVVFDGHAIEAVLNEEGVDVWIKEDGPIN
jgi:hypothetical protein